MSKNSKISASQLNSGRILVVRTDRIGDVVLTLPLVDVLKDHFPQAEIDFLVSPGTLELVSEYPNINKVHTIEKVTASGIRNLCKENSYDLAIVVYPRFAIALGTFLGGVRWRLGTAYRWYSFFFNLKRYEHRKESVKHELEYNLGLLEELGINNIKPMAPKLPVKAADVESVNSKLAAKGVSKGKGYAVIHMPSLGSAKVWSSRNFALLIDLLLKNPKFNKTIILTGTKRDEEMVRGIANGSADDSRVIPVLDFNLNELKALLKSADFFVSNSTGPIHIAAAVGTFVIGLYSPLKVESEIRWGPCTEKKKIFSPAEDSDDRNVMDDISPEEVYDFIMQYLSTKKTVK